eukprot:TRINITY_DN2467_c0_g1_i3.p1 TRINITY_DN2467_c0_g1~~TRINITY_DN2467_c0_g1_i3.p1  ORF type:complete len:1554 (-),score=306.75 TRINITY_DN2467_c0_g1_i3:98-4759(-)
MMNSENNSLQSTKSNNNNNNNISNKEGKRNVFKKIQWILGSKSNNISSSNLNERSNSNNNNNNNNNNLNGETIELNVGESEERKRLVNECLKRMSSNENISIRIQFIKEFEELLRVEQLEESNLLWNSIQDLLVSSIPFDLQFHVLILISSLLQFQQLSNSTRLSIFNWIKSPFYSISTNNNNNLLNPFPLITITDQISNSFIWRLKLLKLLTKDGREIQPFELELGRLILEWLSFCSSHPTLASAELEGLKVEQELVMFNTNLMKYNFGLLEERTIIGLLNSICHICDNATTVVLMENCLRFFDIIVRYGHIPSSCLTIIISSLCRTVNVERFCQSSWHILTNVLKSDYGYQGIKSLCSILLDPNNQSTINLLRGAIFFLGMSVWGSQRISTLSISPSSVLPPLLYVLSSNQNIIYYEVLLSVNRLLKKYGSELKVEWDILITIISKLQAALDMQENTNFATVFSEVISTIGDLYKKQTFSGDRKQLITLLENSLQYQHESVVLAIIDEKMSYCIPMNDTWSRNLTTLMACFLHNEHRSSVKLKVITELKGIYDAFSHFYEEELIEHIVLNHLSHKSCYYPESVRDETIGFLLLILQKSSSIHCNKILEIIERALIMSKGELSIRKKMIVGLIEVLKCQYQGRLYSLIANIFNMMSGFLKSEYDLTIRKEIVSQMMKLKANSKYQVMFGDKLNHNVFCSAKGIQIASKSKFTKGSFDNNQKNCILRIDDFVSALIQCVHQDSSRDLSILSCNAIASILKNRFLASEVDLNKLTTSLCQILKHKVTQEMSKEHKEEMCVHLLQTITLLIGYHNQMSVDKKQEIIASFVNAMNYKWASPESKQNIQRMCLHSLSICLLELPSLFIVHHIGKFIQQSDASVYGLQVLEFLMLLSTTNAATNLSQQDFEKVFSIVVAYLEPKKNSPHVVASAYSVLGAWFLCSPSAQRLHHFKVISKLLYPIIQLGSNPIAEAAIDFMAQYSYQNSRLESERDLPSFLFDGCQTKNWIAGNSIISIKSGQFGYSRVTIRRAIGSIQYTVHFPHSVHSSSKDVEDWLQSAKDVKETLVESPQTKEESQSSSQSLSPNEDQKPTSPLSVPLRRLHPLSNNYLHEKERREEEITFQQQNTDSIARPQKSPNSISLFEFYPPLPSYDYEAEKEDVSSPYLFTSKVEPSLFLPTSLLDEEHKQLNTEGQLMLHCPEKHIDGQLEAIINNINLSIQNEEIIRPESPIHTQSNDSRDLNLKIRHTYSEERLDPLFREEDTKIISNVNLPTSPVLLEKNEELAVLSSSQLKIESNSAHDPSFVFFQMQQIPLLNPKAKVLKNGEALDRAIAVLDRTMGVETHKIGILYVGPGQTTEEEILRNQNGTPRYHKFLQSIGQIVRLEDCRDLGIYTGGLDAGGEEEDEDGGSKRNSMDTEFSGDGEYSLLWKTDVQQIMFHVATLIPNRKTDKLSTNKKRHIGNDNVNIIYSDAENSYQLDTIVGQFNFVAIIVYPLDIGYYRLEIKKKAGIPDFGPISASFGSSQIVTEAALATIVRQSALNGDLADCRTNWVTVIF